MPIHPETVAALMDGKATDTILIGQRLSKDIVLTPSQTWLGILSDRFVIILPEWISLRIAYSLGDLFLVIGFIWFLWSSSQLRISQMFLRLGQ